MAEGGLGRIYQDGEVIVRQGEMGSCMYVIQDGEVQVLRQEEGREVELAHLGQGDFFGEMALFDTSLRSATVRAVGPVRVLTVDKRTFLRRIHEDPSLAFRIVETLSHRLREINEKYSLAPPLV